MYAKGKRTLQRKSAMADTFKLVDLTWIEIIDVSKTIWRKYHWQTDGHKNTTDFKPLFITETR